MASEGPHSAIVTDSENLHRTTAFRVYAAAQQSFRAFSVMWSASYHLTEETSRFILSTGSECA